MLLLVSVLFNHFFFRRMDRRKRKWSKLKKKNEKQEQVEVREKTNSVKQVARVSTRHIIICLVIKYVHLHMIHVKEDEEFSFIQLRQLSNIKHCVVWFGEVCGVCYSFFSFKTAKFESRNATAVFHKRIFREILFNCY